MDHALDQQISNSAADLALLEIVRRLVVEVLFHEDAGVFRKRLSTLETICVDGINGRTLWEGVPDEINDLAKDRATNHVSTILASIIHPTDRINRDLS